MTDSYSLGVDFGTNTVRALIVRCDNGEEAGVSVFDYPSGNQGILLDTTNDHLARQHPGDYLAGLEKSIVDAIRDADVRSSNFSAAKIIGIGIDSTGSSPLPVDRSNRALGIKSEFRDNLNAQCWLWKDHTSYQEALNITRIASESNPEYLAKCGGTYSSEWWWSKIWHCLNVDPIVFEAAYSWVELADWIPSVLAGVTDPTKIVRGICAAGHKAMYAEDWGGLPSSEFLFTLDPQLADLKSRLYEKAFDASTSAGSLCDRWAETTGLKPGIPIAIGEFDVHYGAIGAGVEEGILVKVIGTSTCDCTVVESDNADDIPGICGIVKGSILPGCFAIEAGQSAVGDIFKWWVETICKGGQDFHESLVDEIQNQTPGEHGLLALDWNNGNRTILVDQRLTGLIVGQTLQTTQAEIYRALIEATAFGARMILERIAEYGVNVEKIVCCGGVAERNRFLMQIYADITGREMLVSDSDQTCALGAAIAGAVMGGTSEGGFDDFLAAQAAMAAGTVDSYLPNASNHQIYNSLFDMYKQLHDSFGGVKTSDLGAIMKTLLEIKESKRNDR